MAAGRQQFPQHQRNELPLAGGQGVAGRAAQVLSHPLVQGLLVLRRREFLHQRYALGVRNIRLHLAAQGALAHGGQAAAQLAECVGTGVGIAQRAKLVAKAGQVAKHAVVHHADQPIQLQQGILQRGGRQQHLGRVGQRLFQHLADDVARLVHIAQAVRFVHDHQVPRHAPQIVGLGLGELVAADDDAAALLKRQFVAVLALLLVAFGFQNQRLQAELVLQFLVPLLAQVGGHDDKDAPLAFGPALGDDQTGFDGLAQPHLVGQDDALGQRAVKRKQRGIDLVRVQVHLRVHQRGGQHVGGVRIHAARQKPGDVLGLVGG